MVSENTEPQQVVNRVIARWKHHFSLVLPVKPDLIVVPEACDRPRGLSQDTQTEHHKVRKNQVQDYFFCLLPDDSPALEADGDTFPLTRRWLSDMNAWGLHEHMEAC